MSAADTVNVTAASQEVELPTVEENDLKKAIVMDEKMEEEPDEKDKKKDRKSRRDSRSKSRSRSHSSSRSRSRSASRSRSRSRGRERRRSRRSRSRSRTYSPIPSSSRRVVNGRIHVSDLTASISKRDLEKAFEKFGKVVDIWLASYHPFYAFITYKRDEDAEEAIRKMNDSYIRRQRIRVAHALPRRERFGFRSSFGGAYGGGGYGGSYGRRSTCVLEDYVLTSLRLSFPLRKFIELSRIIVQYNVIISLMMVYNKTISLLELCQAAEEASQKARSAHQGSPVHAVDRDQDHVTESVAVHHRARHHALAKAPFFPRYIRVSREAVGYSVVTCVLCCTLVVVCAPGGSGGRTYAPSTVKNKLPKPFFLKRFGRMISSDDTLVEEEQSVMEEKASTTDSAMVALRPNRRSDSSDRKHSTFDDRTMSSFSGSHFTFLRLLRTSLAKDGSSERMHQIKRVASIEELRPFDFKDVKGLISKYNRKFVAGTALLVAVKLNDYKKPVIVKSAEELLRISRREMLSFELPLCSALQFDLFPPSHHVEPHLRKLMFGVF
uniref:RRM domain-containing protein n=1 Tax=Angiostrongylus cantonensis TaxID=6313 RepID=A0A0K0DA88_ANGCA